MWKILFVILVLFILIAINLVINFGIKMVLMAKRKDSKTMIKELWNRFQTDFTQYEKLPYEEITINSYDGLKLKGYFYNLYPNSNKVVVMNHGYTANHFVEYQFIDGFIEEKFNLLLIDMRSHGESEGKYASYGYNESKDLYLWVKWLKKNKGEDLYIGLHGQSMGAATVMLYGGSHPKDIAFIIEDCGFTTAKEAVEFQFKQAKVPVWPFYDLVRLKIKFKYGFDLNTISPEEIIINSEVPTLFIHGTSDRTVPAWMTKRMYDKKNGQKDRLYLVEGAKHMEACCYDKEEYKEILKAFINSVEEIKKVGIFMDKQYININ
ncbi:alpha/beta hydrolase [Clostridium tarantellae]|nr:alpha/beta hydrolase [Clostridium tarantellae]